MTTEKQKRAVRFCEQWLHITFEGDIDDYEQVSSFLSFNLEDAKNLYRDAACEYEAYIADLD